MLDIRPVTDLRNHFPDIENAVKAGNPVFLTKNGYGTMVVLSIEAYSALTDHTEQALDEADHYARTHSDRMTHDEVFRNLRGSVNA